MKLPPTIDVRYQWTLLIQLSLPQCAQTQGGDFQDLRYPVAPGYAEDGVTTSCGNGGTIWCSR